MSHPRTAQHVLATDRSPRGTYGARLGAVLALIAVGALAACGSDDGKAADTLPPIATTTTTTTMPPTTTTIPDSYVIAKGDSLSEIAKRFGLSTAELAAYNGITDYDKIDFGQELMIPKPGEATTTTTGVSATTGASTSTTVNP